MSADRREELIRDALASFVAGDVNALTAFLHPEIECRVVSPILNAGTWHGHPGFVVMTREWEEAFGEISYEILGFEPLDERNILVAIHQQAIGAGSGVPVALDVWFLIEFDDERAVRFQVHASRESAVAAA